MKKTIINLALLFAAIIYSAYVSGQSSIWATAQNIEEVKTSE